MPGVGYDDPASPADGALLEALIALGAVGYAALGRGQQVVMRRVTGLVTDTTPESNFYEELLVNPTLLTLAAQRGQFDCGGLDYVAVGYGGFIELLMRTKDGHVSLGISAKAHIGEYAAKVRAVLEHHDVDAPVRAEPLPYVVSVDVAQISISPSR